MAIALLLGLFFAGFGVFIFSDWRYRGMSIHEHVWPMFQEGTFSGWADGIFILLGMGFSLNWFQEFSAAAIAASSVGTILTSESVWPVVCTWVFCGFIIGAISRGTKRGLKMGIICFLMCLILWMIFGFFAGADMTTIMFSSIKTTLGKVFTVFAFLLVSGTIGGFTSGGNDSD